MTQLAFLCLTSICMYVCIPTRTHALPRSNNVDCELTLRYKTSRTLDDNVLYTVPPREGPIPLGLFVFSMF